MTKNNKDQPLAKRAFIKQVIMQPVAPDILPKDVTGGYLSTTLLLPWFFGLRVFVLVVGFSGFTPVGHML